MSYSKKKLFAVLLVLMTILVLPNLVFAGKQDFTIVNKSNYTITGLWVAAADDDDWGENIFEGDPLKKGESDEIVFDKKDNTKFWNFSIKDSSGKTWTWEKKKYNLDNISVITFSYKNGKGWLDMK